MDKYNLGFSNEEVKWIKSRLDSFGITYDDSESQLDLFDKIKNYSSKLPIKEREDLYKDMESNIRYISWSISETDEGDNDNEAYVYVSDNTGFKEYNLFDLNHLDDELSRILLNPSTLKTFSNNDKKAIIEKFISVAAYEDHDTYMDGVGDLLYILNDEYLEKLDKMRNESRKNKEKSNSLVY